jgi:hypothetical protein
VRCISGLYFEPRVIEGTKLEEVGGPEIGDRHFNLMLQGGDRIWEFDFKCSVDLDLIRGDAVYAFKVWNPRRFFCDRYTDRWRGLLD